MNNANFSGLSGREIAGCELVRELGSGSSGVVYLANQKRLDRFVACKLLHVENEEDQLFVKNLFAEARNAAKLAHPNVVQALDAGTTDDGINYFIMEYAEGNSLENIRLEHPEMISTRFLINFAIQLSEALEYAWETFAMIHGDIKPGNMLIRSSDMQLKICDLGLARTGNNNDENDSEDVMVTPLYASPEVIRQENKIVDQRSDIYSFGVMLYELICGVAPFQGTLEDILQGHISREPEPLLRKNPDMDKELALFIEKMLKKIPSERPANWKEVKNTFLGFRKRICPEVPVVAIASAGSGSAVKISSENNSASWGEKPGGDGGFFARHPLVLPAILLGIIALAVASIIIQIL